MKTRVRENEERQGAGKTRREGDEERSRLEEDE